MTSRGSLGHSFDGILHRHLPPVRPRSPALSHRRRDHRLLPRRPERRRPRPVLRDRHRRGARRRCPRVRRLPSHPRDAAAGRRDPDATRTGDAGAHRIHEDRRRAPGRVPEPRREHRHPGHVQLARARRTTAVATRNRHCNAGGTAGPAATSSGADSHRPRSSTPGTRIRDRSRSARSTPARPSITRSPPRSTRPNSRSTTTPAASSCIGRPPGTREVSTTSPTPRPPNHRDDPGRVGVGGRRRTGQVRRRPRIGPRWDRPRRRGGPRRSCRR